MVVWLLEFSMIRISVVFSTLHIIFAAAEVSSLPRCHVCLYYTLSCLALKLHQYVLISPRYLFALLLLLCAWAILYIHLQMRTRESFSLQSLGGPSLMSESIWIVRLPG